MGPIVRFAAGLRVSARRPKSLDGREVHCPKSAVSKDRKGRASPRSDSGGGGMSGIDRSGHA